MSGLPKTVGTRKRGRGKLPTIIPGATLRLLPLLHCPRPAAVSPALSLGQQRTVTTSTATVLQSTEPTSIMSDANPLFRVTTASEATCLTDGVALAAPHPDTVAASQTSSNTDDNHADCAKKDPQSSNMVIMPWVGFGTYRLGKNHSYDATLQALQQGYRCIDTAFIYGGETTETQVGQAIQTALQQGIISSRKELFIITKHWRKYHGYQQTRQCFGKSLKRLQLDYVDLYLMHWPGPAYNTMTRRKDAIEQHGPWYYATTKQQDMAHVRAETYRAMEDLQVQGKIKAVGVSNFSIKHLQKLKETAQHWPPAVNQVESHPLFPQNELKHYCEKEGIVFQAYSALGGQDGTRKKWQDLLGQSTDEAGTTKRLPKQGQVTLLNCSTVKDIAHELEVSPSQVLLRYALQRNCAITPKTSSEERMNENACVFDFSLSHKHMEKLDDLAVPGSGGRLCWRTDPLRLLDFD